MFNKYDDENLEPLPLLDNDHDIWTMSGTSFDLFTPPQEFHKYRNDFNIDDIARSLSHICRWGGHVDFFYSVADHCIATAELCLMTRPELAYAGLIHDIPEAYIDDMQRPLKINFLEYREVESLLETVLMPVFGVPAQKHPFVKRMDSFLAVAEAHVLKLPYVFQKPGYEKLVSMAKEFFAENNLTFDDVVKKNDMNQTRKDFTSLFKSMCPKHIEITENGFVFNEKVNFPTQEFKLR